MPKIVAPAALLLLAACNQQASAPLPGDTASPQVATVPSATASASPAAPAITAVPMAAPTAAPVPSQSRDPQTVMIEWARAVSTRNWPLARAYWGDHGTRSNLSEAAFAAKWRALGDPQVDVGKGDQEGAAGSSYYTAPVTIRDGKRTIKGEVVIRRVNDVDGATPEQLRWHIESTTLAI